MRGVRMEEVRMKVKAVIVGLCVMCGVGVSEEHSYRWFEENGEIVVVGGVKYEGLVELLSWYRGKEEKERLLWYLCGSREWRVRREGGVGEGGGRGGVLYAEGRGRLGRYKVSIGRFVDEEEIFGTRRVGSFLRDGKQKVGAYVYDGIYVPIKIGIVGYSGYLDKAVIAYVSGRRGRTVLEVKEGVQGDIEELERKFREIGKVKELRGWEVGREEVGKYLPEGSVSGNARVEVVVEGGKVKVWGYERGDRRGEYMIVRVYEVGRGGERGRLVGEWEEYLGWSKEEGVYFYFEVEGEVRGSKEGSGEKRVEVEVSKGIEGGREEVVKRGVFEVDE